MFKIDFGNQKVILMSCWVQLPIPYADTVFKFNVDDGMNANSNLDLLLHNYFLRMLILLTKYQNYKLRINISVSWLRHHTSNYFMSSRVLLHSLNNV